MAKFQIPKPFLPGFDALFTLDNDSINQLAVLLRNMPVGTGPKEFQNILSTNTSIEGIKDISRTLFSLGIILFSQENSIAELASELTTSYKESKGDNLFEDKQNVFKEKLQLLFSDSSNLKLTFKAIKILSENDQTYRAGRILTDIRLIFNDNLEEVNRNAVIIHRLKIDYKKDNDYKEFFASLDTTDLKKLKEQIDRALEKERLIRDNYKENISFIRIGS